MNKAHCLYVMAGGVEPFDLQLLDFDMCVCVRVIE